MVHVMLYPTFYAHRFVPSFSLVGRMEAVVHLQRDGPEAGMGRGIPGFSSEALRRARRAARLTVGEFAAEAEVSETTVHRWEAGSALPTAYNLSVIGYVLSRDPADFVTGQLNQLRAWRVLAGMSIDAAARQTGLSRSTVYRLEQAAIDNPADDTVAAVAAAYSRTANEIRTALIDLRAARLLGAKARGTARRAQQ